MRVHTGKCCFKPGYKDLGGTAVIGATSPPTSATPIRATLDLKPGTYTFLCSIAGHFQAGQRGTLVVELGGTKENEMRLLLDHRFGGRLARRYCRPSRVPTGCTTRST